MTSPTHSDWSLTLTFVAQFTGPPLCGMFPTAGLFRDVPCPMGSKCSRSSFGCLFSHDEATFGYGLHKRPTEQREADAKRQRVVEAANRNPSQPQPQPQPRTVERTSVVKMSPSTSKLLGNATMQNPAKYVKPSPKPTPQPVRKPQNTVAAAPIPSGAFVSTNADSTTGLRLGRVKSVHAMASQRMEILKAFHKEYVRLYATLADRNLAEKQANRDASLEEVAVHNKSNKATYRTMAVMTLTQLKKRELAAPDGSVGCGTLDEANKVKQEKEHIVEEFKKNLTWNTKAPQSCHSKEMLKEFGFPVEIPSDTHGPGSHPTALDCVMQCSRCGKEWTVTRTPNPRECEFHDRRVIKVRREGRTFPVYECCEQPRGSVPCQTGVHVFRDSTFEAMHERRGFVMSTDLKAIHEKNGAKYDIIALDCELVFTEAGMELARLSVTDDTGFVILDEFVRPKYPVLDPMTKFSGIAPNDPQLMNAVHSLESVREALGGLMHPETVIVGHGLENDLCALRLIHLHILDSALLYEHPVRGFRFRLKDLAQKYLHRFIQDGGEAAGHDAFVDALTSLDLVKYKLEHDDSFIKPISM